MDVDHDALTYRLSGKDAKFFQIDSKGNISFTANTKIDEHKTYQISVDVRDPSGANDTQLLTIKLEDDHKMKGGVGTDLFVFQPEFEGVISNFVAGQDVLQLHHTGLTNVQAMIDAHALTVTQHGKDTIVDVRAPGHYNNGIWHDHDQIVLKGVTLSLFGTDSFLIA